MHIGNFDLDKPGCLIFFGGGGISYFISKVDNNKNSRFTLSRFREMNWMSLVSLFYRFLKWKNN